MGGRGGAEEKRRGEEEEEEGMLGKAGMRGRDGGGEDGGRGGSPL